MKGLLNYSYEKKESKILSCFGVLFRNCEFIYRFLFVGCFTFCSYG